MEVHCTRLTKKSLLDYTRRCHHRYNRCRNHYNKNKNKSREPDYSDALSQNTVDRQLRPARILRGCKIFVGEGAKRRFYIEIHEHKRRDNF